MIGNSQTFYVVSWRVQGDGNEPRVSPIRYLTMDGETWTWTNGWEKARRFTTQRIAEDIACFEAKRVVGTSFWIEKVTRTVIG